MGIVNLKINNVSFAITEADVEIQPSNHIVKPKPNGFTTVENTTPSIKATFQIPDELSITDILENCSQTVIAEEWNGRTWVLEKAQPTFEGAPWNSTQGTLMITWVGSKIREINPNKSAPTN
jgi:hypothetical protein